MSSWIIDKGRKKKYIYIIYEDVHQEFCLNERSFLGGVRTLFFLYREKSIRLLKWKRAKIECDDDNNDDYDDDDNYDDDYDDDDDDDDDDNDDNDDYLVSPKEEFRIGTNEARWTRG